MSGSSSSPSLPIPPIELAGRVGGAYPEYRSIGAGQRVFIESALPAGWSFDGKAILDFGCGAGRTLCAFASEAATAEFFGCDIHAPSIAWAQAHLSPPFRFTLCGEAPPLDFPDHRFDLVYAMSVFTHITSQWSAWLVDLHRVMRPGGLAVISVLGRAIAPTILGHPWDDRIGMAIVDLHKHWDIGGPSVLLAEWWIREHWGRVFEILGVQQFEVAGGPGHDIVLMRRRDVEITPALLADFDPADPREQAAIACNLELVLRQQEALGERIRELSGELQTALQSPLGRLTRLLRRAKGVARRCGW